MRSIAEALASMLPVFSPLGEEEVHLTESSGRYVSRDVTARFDSPPFDNSAMDGYAVRAADVASASPDAPVRLPVGGESRAGGPLPEPLRPGTACRIYTGAPMPAGADAVIMQEDTDTQGEEVTIRESSHEGKHVRAQGTDVSSGALLLQTGDRLWPGEIGLLASQNIDRVHVFRRPQVALLSTGDELRELGDDLEPGAIINSNVYVLTEMLRALGVNPVPLPAAPDTLPEVEAALRKALEADVVITMGGVSVGAYDFVHEAFKNVGVEPGFWKVRIKPGKPLAFAQYEGKPVVGLPGNPISAMVTFEVLVAPCLRKMLGDPQPHPQPVVARLRNAYRRRPGRVEIARAVATREGDEIIVALHDRQGSGSLPSFVGVNALVILPSDRAELAAGDRVEAILWGPGLRGVSSVF
ncbi:MAG: molybdopterin molybdotransferase MoeA, partial [Deltaproteobacteria bacterium]|nr:molybdopterin molybdotransferase MoeA [Deltaproteobacteria bacterium]